MRSEPTFRAVLFDWRGTLVVALTNRSMVETALERLDRDRTPAAVDQVLEMLNRSDTTRVDSSLIDTDAAEHQAAYRDWFAAAGVDAQLAEAMYDVESDPHLNPFAADVGQVLVELADAGVRIGVISDIHVDIRPAFTSHTLVDGRTWAELIDVWELSYELGVAKPDPAIFRRALYDLSVAPQEVLMVGDRGAWDGAAADLGIVTLVLPTLETSSETRLHHILNLVLPNRGP